MLLTIFRARRISNVLYASKMGGKSCKYKITARFDSRLSIIIMFSHHFQQIMACVFECLHAPPPTHAIQGLQQHVSERTFCLFVYNQNKQENLKRVKLKNQNKLQNSKFWRKSGVFCRKSKPRMRRLLLVNVQTGSARARVKHRASFARVIESASARTRFKCRRHQTSSVKNALLTDALDNYS